MPHCLREAWSNFEISRNGRRGMAVRLARYGAVQLQLQGIYHPRVAPRATGRAPKAE